MRLSALALSITLVGCGTPTGTDAGIDSGVNTGGMDSGFDAGPAPMCLVDRLDAGNTDAGWDGGYDFSCLGQPRPGGGQAELVLSGITTRAGFSRTPMAGIQLDLVLLDGTVVATTFSNDAGAYTLKHDAGCLPFDGEVRATSLDVDAGFAVAYALPDAPWRYDRGGLELVMFDYQTQGLAAALANVTLVDGNAALAISVEDCAGNSVEGAVVTVPMGDVRYVGASGLPSSMLSATSSSGDLIIFNVPGTSISVTATLDGGVIGQRTFPVHPRAVTGSFLSP
ncbi:MAG: hypothetical protein QM817_34505 [Archangium sp.]